MLINFQCPNCKCDLVAPESLQGEKTRCQNCQCDAVVPFNKTQSTAIESHNPHHSLNSHTAIVPGTHKKNNDLVLISSILIAALAGVLVICISGLVVVVMIVPTLSKNGRGRLPTTNAPSNSVAANNSSNAIESSDRVLAAPKVNDSSDRAHAIQRKFQYRLPISEWIHYRVKVGQDKNRENSIVDGNCKLQLQSASDDSTDDGNASGTGFAISADGLIATCAHVVYTATFIEVVQGTSKVPAKIVAIDTENDLAIIAISGSQLQPLALESSAQVTLAQPVMVVGYPLTGIRDFRQLVAWRENRSGCHAESRE
jgi:S1-C subfamily serine protease